MYANNFDNIREESKRRRSSCSVNEVLFDVVLYAFDEMAADPR